LSFTQRYGKRKNYYKIIDLWCTETQI